jgi:hypothetical protein
LLICFATFTFMVYYNKPLILWAHDIGLLGIYGQLVMNGKIPHIDYVDVYSGGLSLIIATAFSLLGISSKAIFAIMIPVAAMILVLMFLCLSQFIDKGWALLITMATALQSVFYYQVPMPTWFITLGGLAQLLLLLRWHRDRNPYWMFFAGCICGITFAIKITAVYAGALMLCSLYPVTKSIIGKIGRQLLFFCTMGFFTALALSVTHAYAILFILLPCLLALSCLYIKQRSDHTDSYKAFCSYCLGGLSIVIPWALFYLKHKGIQQLVDGILIKPSSRLTFAAMHPDSLSLVICFITSSVIFFLMQSGTRARITYIIAAILLAVTSWQAPFAFLLILPLLFMSYLAYQYRDKIDYSTLQVSLFYCAHAFGMLPFTHEGYLAYNLPLFSMLCVVLLRTQSILRITRWSFTAAILLSLYGFQYFYLIHNTFPFARMLQTPRGIAHVLHIDYYTIRTLLRCLKHTPTSDAVLIGPDSPHLYFFSGHHVQQPSPYDFFEPKQINAYSAARPDTFATVIINRNPEFSKHVTGWNMQILKTRYPFMKRVGAYTVFSKYPLK